MQTIFVHGLFGWGPGELGGLPYWGDALAQLPAALAAKEIKCGPLSSFHDRACELFAQIKGTKIDYGEPHSGAAGHAQFSTDHSGNGLFPEWSAENPIILIGHSAGAHSCIKLQQLLAQNFWGIGTSARWVRAIVSIAGVLNGSTLCYHSICAAETGRIVAAPAHVIGDAIEVIQRIQNGPAANEYDLWLDHWGIHQPLDASVVGAIERTEFLKGEDNLAFDLSLQGCFKANSTSQAYVETYYLSIVTSKTVPVEGVGRALTKLSALSALLRGRDALGGPVHRPELDLSPPLQIPSYYQGVADPFANPRVTPIPPWRSREEFMIDNWHENDGAVSTISQRYPFSAGNHAVGGEGIFGRPIHEIRPGRWYYESAEAIVGKRFDHLDVAVGCKFKALDPTVERAQKRLYARLGELLLALV